jgi:hypothetical protein
MEFAVEGKQYRLERGISTGRWLLFEHRGPQVTWRLIDMFDAGVDEEDATDRAKAAIKFNHYSRQES